MDQRKYDVITVGETTVDAFMTVGDPGSKYRVDREHHDFCIRPGEKIDVERYDFCMGGNATNVAVGLARLGFKVGLCSEIGDDEFSIKIRNWLANENIERLLVKQVNGPSSFAVVLNFHCDRTIFVQDVQREHNFDFSEVTTPFVYLTSLGNEWEEPYKKVLEFVEQHNATLAFNPGSRQVHSGSETVKLVLAKATYLFVNKEEAELLLTGQQTQNAEKLYILDLLKRLQQVGPKVIAITDGKNGSYVINEEGETYWYGATDGEVVERTGAGDSYASGFIGAVLSGLPVSNAIEWAASNATSVVGKTGAQAGLLTREEMEDIAGLESVKKSEGDSSNDDFHVIPAPLE